MVRVGGVGSEVKNCCTIARVDLVRAGPWVVRYGAGCPRREEVEHEGKPAPNTPYATSPRFPIPDSRFPIPDSRSPPGRG
ncbi:hypothetical protein [Moorena producens]|uniref:hypothetical protein n=1 Tax=Moorena producens TaxID=1155739 RepID=UPI003C77F35B